MLKYPSLNILPVKFTILYSEKIGSHLKTVKTLEKRCVCVCVCVCVCPGQRACYFCGYNTKLTENMTYDFTAVPPLMTDTTN